MTLFAVWALFFLGVAVLVALGAFLFRRRRSDEEEMPEEMAKVIQLAMKHGKPVMWTEDRGYEVLDD